jgi:hypothetical protein
MIVDHILRYEVGEREANNELVTLHQLAVGLAALANTVAQLEAPLQQGPNRQAFFDLTPLGIDQQTADLLPSLFHWYGTTVCNYARLVGFLSGIAIGKYERNVGEDPDNYDMIKKQCDDYIARVPELAEVLVWRNKVFAHFAITAPRNGKKDQDNAALLDVSTMSPIAFSNRRFHAGGLMNFTRGAEAQMPTWSLTRNYELLSKRYWPEALPA